MHGLNVLRGPGPVSDVRATAVERWRARVWPVLRCFSSALSPDTTPLTSFCQITACSEYLRYECAHAWQWSSNSLMVLALFLHFPVINMTRILWRQLETGTLAPTVWKLGVSPSQCVFPCTVNGQRYLAFTGMQIIKDEVHHLIWMIQTFDFILWICHYRVSSLWAIKNEIKLIVCHKSSNISVKVQRCSMKEEFRNINVSKYTLDCVSNIFHFCYNGKYINRDFFSSISSFPLSKLSN